MKTTENKEKKPFLGLSKQKIDSIMYAIRQTSGQAILSAMAIAYLSDRIKQGNDTVNLVLSAIGVAFLLYYTNKR